MSFLLFTDRQPQLLWGWAGDLFGFDGCCWCCPTRKAAGGNCGQVWCTWLSVSGDWKLSCELSNSLCHQIALAKRADKVYPVPGPWINGGVIKSLANMAAGTKPPGSTDCEDNDGLAISLPTALASNSQDLPLKVIPQKLMTDLGSAHLIIIDHPIRWQTYWQHVQQQCVICHYSFRFWPTIWKELKNQFKQLWPKWKTLFPKRFLTCKQQTTYSSLVQVAGGEEVVACVEGGASVAEAVAKFGKVSSSLHNQHFNFSLLSFPLVKNTLKKVSVLNVIFLVNLLKVYKNWLFLIYFYL